MRKILKQGGLITTSEAIEQGIDPRFLYRLRDEGELAQYGRGLFGLPDLPDVSDPDLAIVSKRVPKGVICLISALYFHKLSVQVPYDVHIALPQGHSRPKISQPPIHCHWFSSTPYQLGIEEYSMGGIPVLVYSKEKTIVDCFRHRSKIGIEVAIEALKNYWSSGKADLDQILNFAQTLKAEKIIRPYVEVIIHDQS